MHRTSRRRSARHNRLYLALVSAGLLTGGIPLDALALNFTVNTVLDTADANPGDGTAADSLGRASLRAAIDEANALGGSHTISFNASLIGNGDATINLSLFDTGLDNGEYGPTALPVNAGVSITLQGPSGDNGITIQRAVGASSFRLFHVKPTGSLTINNLAFANGYARGGDGSSRGAGGGGAAGLGGAIFNEGTVALEGVTLSGNSAEGGGGGLGNSSSDGGGGGGGVGGPGSNANNQTGGSGGAPNGGGSNGNGGTGGGGGGGNGRSAAGSQTANAGGIGGTFGGGGGGGAVLATGGGSGTATAGKGGNGGFGGGAGGGGGVQSFNYTRNPGAGGTAGFGAGAGSGGASSPSSQPKNGDGGGGMGAGGAIFNYGGTLTVRNSTLSGNTAQGGSSGYIVQYGSPGPAGAGGAGSGFGAAIFSTNRGGTSASTSLRHVTIADNANSAGLGGGGAGAASGSVYVLGNGGTSQLTANNTIIANTSGGNDFVSNTISAGTATSSGVGNLIETNTGFGGSIVTTADPNLAGLTDNRGPTPTRALNAGSPAVDVGNAGQVGGLSTDQRGGMFARVADGDLNGSSVVDIGAYELIQIDYGDAPDYVSGTGPVEVLLENGTDDYRISVTGADSDGGRSATNARVAYNATANEYLVVWSSDATADNDFEIWGQRVDATTRTNIGSTFRISSAVTAGVQDAFSPDVAWSSSTNEYLVVWYGDLLATDNEFEIFGRTVSATGSLTGSQLRISTMGANGDTTARADQPRVAYSPTNNEFLVVWRGDEAAAPLVDNENELFGQRVNAGTRALAGSRMQISFMAGANGDANFDASNPSISRNSASNQFLVTWHSDDNSGGQIDNEQEAFGRFVAGGGTPLGSQFRISTMGGLGNTTYRANNTASAFNAAAGEFLVVWYGDDSSLVDNEIEIWGQRIHGTTGANVGAMFQISDVGNPGDTARFALNPDVAFSPATGNYLIAYQGDEIIDNENEIWARRVSASGVVLDADEVRLSTMGSTDGDTSFGAFNAAVAFDSSSGDTLVVFNGDDDSGSLVDGHNEIYGQFVTDTPLVDYQTRGADNGPAHIRVAGLTLGASTDNDPDGQPSLDADGDDLNGIDDEESTDSLIEFAAAAPTLTVNVTNTSGSAATLYGWIDYDGDGLFENATERGTAPVPDGTNGANVQLTLPVPPASPAINTFLRLRLSGDAAAANATGVATGGEVEDYPAINNIDTTPNAFSFTDQTGVPRSTQRTSDPITVTGVNSPTPISVSSGTYSINGGSFTSAAGNVSDGDEVRARHTSSASFSSGVSTTVTIGGVVDVFTSTTEAIDTNPDAFAFTPTTNVPLSSQQTSNAITVTGINSPAPISVVGGMYSIDGGGYTASAGTVSAGSNVTVRHTASASFGTQTDTTLSIGLEDGIFSSTTLAEDITPDAFVFIDQTGVNQNVTVTSAPITVNGINSSAPISVSGGSYSINGGAFTSAAGSVTNGAEIRAQHTSAAMDDTPVNTVVTIGGVSDTFTSRTRINGTDAAITKTDGLTQADSGGPVTYTIVVSNAGTDPIIAASVTDTIPGSLTAASWTCVGSGGGTCTAVGSGDINDSVDLPVGAFVTYTLDVTVSPTYFGVFSNTASVAMTGGAVDIQPGNNSSTDDTSTNQLFADGFED